MFHNRKRGQALTEFALVMPILLLLMMGIFDFGRVFFTYVMASNALRSALRNAEVYGYSSTDISYLDCDQMRATIAKTFFLGNAWNDTNLKILYVKHDDTSITHTCDEVLANPSLLENGDLLTIDISNSVKPVTPLISQLWPSINFNFHGERTIVEEIGMETCLVSLDPCPDEYKDTDFDGLADQWENTWFGSYKTYTGSDDPDDDGCNNGCEYAHGTDPNIKDTDGDGLEDGPEVFTYHSDPTKIDTDGDGLTDYEEVMGIIVTINHPNGTVEARKFCDRNATSPATPTYCNPTKADTDSDGLTDYEEVNGILVTVTAPDGTTRQYTLYSDPGYYVEADGITVHYQTDSDGDGISDYDEVKGYVATDGARYYSDPLTAQSDNDGISDYDEVMGTFGYITNPLFEDSDNDGINDNVEEITGVTINGNTYKSNPANKDADGDGLTDYQELYGYHATDGNTYYSNPNLRDSDNDRLSDYDEVTGNNFGNYITDPMKPDTDGDKLDDYYETHIYHSNPLSNNSDGSAFQSPGDTLTDWDEVKVWFSKPNQWDSLLAGCPDDLAVAGAPSSAQYPACDGVKHGGVETDGDGLPDDWEIAHFGSISAYSDSSDPDNDGCDNTCEYALDLDPLKPDTDGDGLTDGQEANGFVYNGITIYTDPHSSDTDGDGVSDGDEINKYGSDPTKMDTDGDSLTDGQEVNGVTIPDYVVNGVHTFNKVLTSNPVSTDSDSDSLSDYAEVMGTTGYITDPSSTDTDGDGLTDGDEVRIQHTDPTKQDSDSDGLSDGDEINQYGTIPTNSDSDSDGLTDGQEVNGYQALNGVTYTSSANLNDTDGDGLTDSEEVKAALGSISNPNLRDSENDGISDYAEVKGVTVNHFMLNGVDQGDRVLKSNPLSSDSDSDGLTDYQEVYGYTATNGQTYITDPLNTDTDSDTLTDYNEATGNINAAHDITDPTKSDTDSDGVTDKTDVYPANKPTLSFQSANPHYTAARPTGTASVSFQIDVLVANANNGQSMTITYHTAEDGTSNGALCTNQSNNKNDFICETRTVTFTMTGSTPATHVGVRILSGQKTGANKNKANETFLVVIDSVTLSSPTGSASLGTTSTATVTIEQP